MIGQIQRLVGDGVEVGGLAFARPLARVQQHVLDDAVGALAVLVDLAQVLAHGLEQILGVVARLRLQRL